MEYDVIIIGGGPGGRACAQLAGSHGLQVALIEKEGPGGVAVQKGYFPVKSLLQMVKTHSDTQGRELLPLCLTTIKEGIRIWEEGLKKNRVQVFHGTGIIETPQRITVRGKEKKITLKGKNLVIATGTVPVSPFPEPLDPRKGLLSYLGVLSQQALEIKDLLILGGDVEGCEFATLFQGLGAQVTILEIQDRILPSTDGEMAGYLQEELQRKGIRIITGSQVKSFSFNGRQGQITYQQGEESALLQGERVLITGNHKPLLPPGGEALNLIRQKGGFIQVDATMKTSQEGVYAIGDVIGGIAAANAAILEGETAAKAILGEADPVDYRGMAAVFFTSPMITAAGYTEEDLQKQGKHYHSYQAPFSENFRATTLGHQRGLVKLLVDAQDETLLGIHMVGHEVSELNALASLMIQSGLTVTSVRKLPLAHPTLGEAVKEALQNPCSDKHFRA